MKNINPNMKSIFLILGMLITVSTGFCDGIDEWRKRLIKAGRAELKRVEEQNRINDSKGQSHLNSYLVMIDTPEEYPNGDYLKQRKGVAKGGEETVPYLIQPTVFTELDGTLKKMNSTSVVKTFVLVVHFMPLEFFNEIPDNQSIADFFSGQKTDLVRTVADPISQEARDIVLAITNPQLLQATTPTLYCGFVHFKVYKNKEEGMSQWVYYPRNTKLEFPDNYKQMLNSFLKSETWPSSNVSKVETLIKVLTKNNEEYKKVKGALATITSINDPYALAEALSGIDINGFAAFDATQRIHALKVLSAAEIPDEWEGLIYKLVASVLAPGDASRLITAFGALNEKVPATIETEDLTTGVTSSRENPKKDWCLLQCITNETGDATLGVWGGDNYKLLIKSLIELCRLAPEFVTKVEELADTTKNDLLASKTIFYNYNSFWSKLASSVSQFPNPKIDRTTNYIKECDLETSTELFFSYIFPNTALSNQKLDPFEPIVFVNKSNLGMLADLDGGENVFIAPAIVLKYADDKAWNETATDVTMAVIDAASLATGYGEIKAGVTGLRKAWTILDMANSGINLTLNASLLSQNPQVKKILDAYNLVTGGVAITRMGTGGIRNVYSYIKGKQLLQSDNVKALIQALDDGGEDALRSFTDGDILSIEGLVKKVAADAKGRGLTALDAQAQRIIARITALKNDKTWISQLFNSNADLNGHRSTVALNRKLADYLSIEEEAIIKYYTTSAGYKDFNRALRGEIAMTPEFQAQERLLNQALDKLPTFKSEGPLWRGIKNIDVNLVKEMYKKGSIVTESHFISTAHTVEDFIVSSRARDFEILFKIEGKNGKLIEAISTLPEEAEVLFKSKTKFEVLDAKNELHPDSKFEDLNGYPWIFTVTLKEI